MSRLLAVLAADDENAAAERLCFYTCVAAPDPRLARAPRAGAVVPPECDREVALERAAERLQAQSRAGIGWQREPDRAGVRLELVPARGIHGAGEVDGPADRARVHQLGGYAAQPDRSADRARLDVAADVLQDHVAAHRLALRAA